jgi:hypothetical protein
MSIGPNDLTNQQLLSAITDMFAKAYEVFATKEYIDERLKDFATKDDLKDMEARLSSKLDAHKAANIQHHLVTRKEFGELNRRFDNLRQGLASITV